MTFLKQASLNRWQKGFTLIELIVSLAIIVVIIGSITVAVFQVFSVNEKSKNHMTADKQVENTGHWVSQDAQMAQTVSTVDDGETAETEVLTLFWVGWEREDGGDQLIDTYEVDYTYDANQIRRNEKVTTEVYDSNGHFIETLENLTSTLIAEYITALSVSQVDGKVVLTVTASVGEAAEDRTYEIIPRPTGSG